MKKIKVAELGATGMVGRAMAGLLGKHSYLDLKYVTGYTSVGERYGDVFKVKEANLVKHYGALWKPAKCPDKFKDLIVQKSEPRNISEDVDMIFSALPGGKAQTYEEAYANLGFFVVSNARDMRMLENIALVIGEVNHEHLMNATKQPYDGCILTDPNCSTIQLVVALAPVHRTTRIKRIIISSYQSTSGWGVKGPEELRRQTPMALESLENITFDPTVFARPIAFNCIPHIEPFMEENYTREELKFVYETRKMLGDQNIQISATSVRVPVFVGHGEAIWIETEKPITPEQAYEILKNSPGIILIDDLVGEDSRGDKNERSYPTPLDVHKYGDEVLIGRIRKDLSCPNGLVLWCVADNLRKGAALNVVQIAEELIRRDILKP